MKKTQWMPSSDFNRTGFGYVVSAEAELSKEIVRHCALVSAREDGEDRAGRQKLRLLPPQDVAQRACDIASVMVSIWEERGWIRPTTMTPEEDWAEAGRLMGLRRDAEFAKTKTGVAELIRKALLPEKATS